MGSLRDMGKEQRRVKRLSQDEFTQINKWVWDKIRPKAPYCDIDSEDRKKYNRIEELLSQLL